MSVVRATWESEAKKFLKHGRQRLQRAEIMPLHSSLVAEQNSISRKKQKKEKKMNSWAGETYRGDTKLKMTGSQLDSHSLIKPKHAEAGLGG